MTNEINTVIYAVATALFFALTFLFRKQAINFIPIQLSLLIESIIYFVFFLLIFLITYIGGVKTFSWNIQGISYAFLAGLFLSVAVIFNYLALKAGFLSKIVAITSPSQIIIGVLLGVILLKENLTLTQTFGVLLGLISVILIVR